MTSTPKESTCEICDILKSHEHFDWQKIKPILFSSYNRVVPKIVCRDCEPDARMIFKWLNKLYDRGIKFRYPQSQEWLTKEQDIAFNNYLKAVMELEKALKVKNESSEVS